MRSKFRGGVTIAEIRSRRLQFKKDLAKRLRSQPSDAERLLWHVLRGKHLGDLRFRRQQPIGPFVVDFYCSAAKLIVELDGDQHGIDANAAYDARRTRWLEGRGYKVLRFANWAVRRQEISEIIWRAVESRLPLPERPLAVRPSLKGRVK